MKFTYRRKKKPQRSKHVLEEKLVGVNGPKENVVSIVIEFALMFANDALIFRLEGRSRLTLLKLNRPSNAYENVRKQDGGLRRFLIHLSSVRSPGLPAPVVPAEIRKDLGSEAPPPQFLGLRTAAFRMRESRWGLE